ncbi:FRG domain-containing protein [Vibrio campbellii]|uniref:FRG domain-containing protein n=1 Tax=Vibrio campbellii TaxID=680 RepID=UPI0005EE5EE6|nr:FRG domain-containing protein [Vibrio campbellii]
MQEIYFDTWEEFKDHVSKNYSEHLGLIFRGHRDSSWGIESTLTRLAKNSNSRLKGHQLENLQLDNFKLKVRNLRGSNPSKLDPLEYWALGQHYGLATPLVDWTESLYVAAYFAYEQQQESSTGYRSIFVLDRSGLESDPKFEKVPEVSFYEPIQDDNKRIVSQAGLFTIVPTWYNLIDVLKKCALGKKYLTKLYIPDGERYQAIADLRTMNIHGLSIYPDLHGAAAVSNVLLETMSDNHRTVTVLEELSKSLKRHEARKKMKQQAQP